DDPCVQNPSSPGCGADDYCTMNPSLPGCSQDPCTLDPASCDGGDFMPPTDAYAEGPILFAGCLAAMLGTTIPIAIMQYEVSELYKAIGELDSAQRELQMLKDNNAAYALIYAAENQVRYRQDQYDSTKNDLVMAGIGSLAGIAASVIVCAPAALLPTP
ncbi:MAG TPA: hypothetical protein VF625_02440, partial [Longimicrobium sp.]